MNKSEIENHLESLKTTLDGNVKMYNSLVEDGKTGALTQRLSETIYQQTEQVKQIEKMLDSMENDPIMKLQEGSTNMSGSKIGSVVGGLFGDGITIM